MNRYTATIMGSCLSVLVFLTSASHALADGSIVSWGDDTDAQVTDTPSGTDFEAVAGGGYHSLAIATVAPVSVPTTPPFPGPAFR